jgi:F-type H+-transporting ATPase subunit alpha
LEAFAEFGSELDAESLAQLERGRRVVEVLKQGQFTPIPVEEQVAAIYAVTEGHMDQVDAGDIHEFEAGLTEFLRTRYSGLLSQIADTGELPEDELVAAIDDYKASMGTAGE